MNSAGWKWIERGTDLLWPASLELIFAATLLLLIAVVMHLGLRHAAASLRHRVWALTMGGLLLLPLLCPILPKLPLPLNIPLAAGRPATLTRERTGESAIALSPREEPPSDDVALPAADRADLLPQPPSALPANVSATAVDPRPVAPSSAKPAVGSGRSLLATGHSALILVWALGAVLYLLAMARWLWLERRTAKGAGPLDDPFWQTLLEEMKLQLGIHWVVALGVSQESEVPLTIGWRRPTILLPVDSRLWVADKRRVVLAHELSHVARHDVFWQVAARLACAVYWFHPLTWLAERRMRVERELACDDAVLRSGSQPDQYAAVLLDVAATISRRPPAGTAAIAMACRHPIQRRIRAILQPGLNRLPVGPRTGRLLLAAALILVVLAAGLHPFAPPQVQADPPKPAAADAKSTGSTHPAPRDIKSGTHLDTRDAAAEAKSDNSAVHLMRFRVVNQAGKPIAGATVKLSCVIRGGLAKMYPPAVQTDAEGVATIELPRQKINLVHAYASADKHESARADWANNDDHDVRVPAEVTFRLGQLQAGAPLTVMHKRFVVEGVVIDPQGKPVAGATVGQFGDLWGSDFPRTKTDQKGRYRLPPCEAGGYSIAAAADGYTPDSQWVAVGEGPSRVNLRLRKGEMIRLRIVDKQGKPLPGATVTSFFDNENRREMMLDYQIAFERDKYGFLTDGDGRWTKLWIPGDAIHFQVSKLGFATADKKVAPAGQECVITLAVDGTAGQSQAGSIR